MARQARMESETGIYHVMMRGNNREFIFREEVQKQRFMEYLSNEVQSGGVRLAGWCLMDNHVHLIIQGELPEIVGSLKRINIRFAMGFNTQKKRIGHVFQDRYRSEPIKDDTHLLAVVRYVHNNPVKARMVKTAEVYSWSSYIAYTGHKGLLDTPLRDLVMGCFNNDGERYLAFHLEADDSEHLEIKEDLERYRQERAQEIISSYFERHGMRELSDMKRSTAGVEGLITELLEKGRLPYRKVAELLEVSYRQVSEGRRR